MKKKIIFINILLILLLFIKTANATCTSGVFAIYKTDNSYTSSFNNEKSAIKFTTSNTGGITDSTTTVTQDEGPAYDEECGLLGNPKTEGTLAYYSQLLFNIVKYVGIIACVVLTIFDFAKGLFSEEQELPKNLTKKLTIRLILAVSLFFLPILINFILYFIGVYGTCAIN